MPTLVDVPSLGRIEFPDGMNDDAIALSIKDLLSKEKGGVIQNETKEQSQPEANSDRNEQRQADQQVGSSVQEGVQSSEVQLREPQGQEQPVGNIDTNLKIDAPFQIGGDTSAKENQPTPEGSQGQEAGQGLRSQIPAGNEAKVGKDAGVPSPSSKVPWYKNIPLSVAAQAAFSAIDTAAGFERAGSAPITDVSGVNAPFQRGAKISEVNKAFDEAIADKQSALQYIEDIVDKQGFSVAEYSNQISDLQRDISSLKTQKAETLKLPQYSEENQKMLQGERQDLAKGSTELSKTAESMFPALGVSKKDTSFSAQIGRGVGQVAALVPAMVAGPLALPVMVIQGGSQAYAEGYNGAVEQLKKAGVTDEATIESEAHKLASEAAVKTVPSLAAYTVGGVLTTQAMSALLKGATPLVSGLAGGVAAAGVNSAVSTGLRVSEGGDVLPTAEQAVPDILFGALHGFGAYSNARAEVIKANLDKVDLPETAVVVKEEIAKPQKVRYSSEEQLLKDTTIRLNQLKAKPAEELTTEEANELEFLRGVPSVDELAAGYGVSVRKPTYSSKEIIQSRLDDATTELTSLAEKEKTNPLNAKETKRKAKLEGEIAKNQELLDTGKTLEAENARKEAEKTKKQDEATKPEPPKEEEGTTTKDSSEEIEAIYKTAEEALKRGDRDTAIMSLNAAKEAEAYPENATSKEGQVARNERWNIIDAALEGIKIEPTERKPVETEAVNPPDTTVNPKQVEVTAPVVEKPVSAVEQPVKVPRTIELARSVEEAKAWGKQQISRLSKSTSKSAQRERERVNAKVSERVAQLDGSNKPVVAPKTIELAKSIEEAKAWGTEKTAKLANVKSESAKRELERIKAKVNERVAQLEKSGLDNGKPRAVPKKDKPLPKKPKGTRLLAAAYKRLSDGKIFYGANHKEALLESGMSWKDIQSKYGSPSQRETPEFGYKTNSYDFVTRREAEQVGTASKQIDAAGREADNQLGLDLHSNRIALDEFPTFKAPEFSMGAARPSEFADQKAFNETLVKGTQAHESIKGELTFDKWKSAFLSGLKKGGQYTESQLKSIFQESEGLNAYAKSFGKNVEDIIDFPELWSGKSAKEIEKLSENKRAEDIDLTNENIDKLRESLGYEPIMKQEAQRWGDVWKEAMLQINSNVSTIPSLIAQLRTRPRPLSPVEKATVRYATLDALHTLDNKTRLLASASDKVERRKYTQEYEQANKDLNELLEIERRTASASGSSLNAVKLINKASTNVFSMIEQYKAAKGSFNKENGRVELSPKELERIRDQSKALTDAMKVRDEALQEIKIKEADQSISEFLESSKNDRKAGEVITDLSVDEQITQYTMEIETAEGDSMSMGVATRGLARAISEKLNTTDVAKVSKAVHDRIVDVMGKEWTEDNTKDVLAGNGVFGQHTERGANSSLSKVERQRYDFDRELERVMKAKTPRERDLKMTKLLERYRVDVKHLEPQIEEQTELMITRISKLIGELKNNELRPCE